MPTPRELDTYGHFPPQGGWEEGVYIAEVAYDDDNVIHRSILYVANTKIDNPEDPLWHPCNFICLNGDKNHPRDAVYLKPVRKIADGDEFGF